MVCILGFQFFAEAGFPCPSRRNPSDHFLRCVNSDFDVVTAALKGSLRLRVCIHLFLLLFMSFSSELTNSTKKRFLLMTGKTGGIGPFDGFGNNRYQVSTD